MCYETIDPVGVTPINSRSLNEQHFYMNDVVYIDDGVYEDVPHHVWVRVCTMGYTGMVQLMAHGSWLMAVLVVYIVIPGTLEEKTFSSVCLQQASLIILL